MEIDIATAAAIVLLIAIILAGGALFKSMFENPQIVYIEAPLHKNMPLQLLPGEQYRYSYRINGTEANITYQVLEGYGCTRIAVLESVNGTGVCLDSGGMDGSGSNSSFANPSILLFKPWMLALQEGWKWNNSMYLSYNGALQHISDNSYRVVRLENYSGRESYIVEIKSSTGPAEYDWVDAEKRVLLKIEGDGYEIVLSDG
jgi:hypothetical protein